MDGEIKIFLPEHVTSTMVFHVLSKFIGTYYSKDYPLKKRANTNIPAAIGNDWEIKFIHPYNSSVTLAGENLEIEKIKICDFLDVVHIFDYYKKTTLNGHILNNEVMLISESSAVNGSFAKKLVDFFGGKMIVTNSEDIFADSKGVNYIYECMSPIHVPLKKGKSIKKYKHQFTNELAALEIITAQELVEMRGKTAWSHRDTLLLRNLDFKFAESYFQMEDLTKNLSQNSEHNPAKRMKM
jgi:hypothetical protein